MLARRVCALVAAFAVCMLIVHDVSAHGVSLDLHHPLAADSAFHRAFLVPWARKVAQDSGNRINIHLHAASAGPIAAKGLYEQAEDGDADLVWAPILTSVERFPRLGIVDAPFMAHTAQGASRAVSEYVRINDLLDRDLGGVRVLAVHVADGTQLHWSGSAATPSAEVAGKRIAVARAAAYGAAWAPKPPSDVVWTARPWVHPTERQEQGRLARKRVPRASHAAFEPRADRDPIAILDRQETDRLDFLIPLRHARMAESDRKSVV
jgi:TRAP-type C4-dicarboxylate transport system substrate-binding protein